MATKSVMFMAKKQPDLRYPKIVQKMLDADKPKDSLIGSRR